MQQFVRGARVDAVLRHGARVFQHSAGSSASYALSKEVDRLDAFLSHTWSTPRWKTFMALCLHYNASIAFATAFLVGVLLSVGVAVGMFPVVQMSNTVKYSTSSAPYATMAVPVVFQVVVHTVHELLPRSSRVFLDKLCIHQTDDVQKLEGVVHLGLTIFFSSTMVVLDSDSYFNRLWTVYELGSCLVVDRNKLIVFLPVNLPPYVHGCSAAVCAGTVIFFLVSTAEAEELFPILSSLSFEARLFVLNFVALAIFVVIMRRWSREQDRRKSRVHNFSIRNAVCTDERDREAVQANIVNLVKDAGLFASGLSPNQALDLFDEFVRQEMPKAMDKSSLRLVHCWIMGLALLGRGLDRCGAHVLTRVTLRHAALDFCFFASHCIFVGPEAVWFVQQCTRRCLKFTGVAELIVHVRGVDSCPHLHHDVEYDAPLSCGRSGKEGYDVGCVRRRHCASRSPCVPALPWSTDVGLAASSQVCGVAGGCAEFQIWRWPCQPRNTAFGTTERSRRGARLPTVVHDDDRERHGGQERGH